MVAIGILVLVNPAPLSYFDVSTISASAATLALAAIGETIVILAGGLDLSAGAVISLVNVVLVTQLGSTELSPGVYALAATAISLGIGAGIGAINGLLVGYLRLQSIVVTLATMFCAQGAALLILRYPGGEVSYDFSMLLVGDVIPSLLPAPVLVMAAGLACWLFLKQTRLGIAIYAIGSDAGSAAANRVNVAATRLWSFTIAGAFFGWAGLFVTANTGSGDPLIGAPMLLKIFAAVVLGGTMIGGGRGGAVGTLFVALTLTILVNIFLVLGVRTYYVPIVEGAVLILAVLGFAAGRHLPIIAAIRRFGAWSARSAARSVAPLALGPPVGSGAASDLPGWLARNASTLHYVLPAYVLFVAAALTTAAINSGSFSFSSYVITLLVFATFLAVLGLGQGAVIIAGGLDLSIAWTITFPAIVVTTYANASDSAALWAVPLALALGALIGPRQRNAGGRAAHFADYRDARSWERAGGHGTRLQRRGADGCGSTLPCRLRQRPFSRRAAHRVVPRLLHDRRDPAPRPERVRPPAAGSGLQRMGCAAFWSEDRRGRRRRLCAKWVLRRARRPPPRRLHSASLLRHGQALSGGVDRRCRSRRYQHHRWARSLHRHSGRRPSVYSVEQHARQHVAA
jgi:ribose transport system permease protein